VSKVCATCQKLRSDLDSSASFSKLNFAFAASRHVVVIGEILSLGSVQPAALVGAKAYCKAGTKIYGVPRCVVATIADASQLMRPHDPAMSTHWLLKNNPYNKVVIIMSYSDAADAAVSLRIGGIGSGKPLPMGFGRALQRGEAVRPATVRAIGRPFRPATGRCRAGC
jgi:hypothetical protein